MTRKSGKHLHATYGTQNSAYRDLHHWRSNEQSQDAEVETLHLGHRSKPYTSDPKLTSYGGNARPLNLMCLEGTFFKYDVTLQRTRSPLRPYIYIYIYMDPSCIERMMHEFSECEVSALKISLK